MSCRYSDLPVHVGIEPFERFPQFIVLDAFNKVLHEPSLNKQIHWILMKTVVMSKTRTRPRVHVHVHGSNQKFCHLYLHLSFDLTSGTLSGLGAPPDLTGLARPGALM